MIDSAASARRRESLDTVVGLMAAAAILVGFLAMLNISVSIAGADFAFRPVRVGVATVVLALVAAGMGGRHRRLAGIAVVIASICWMLGMVIAVATGHPLF